MQATIFKYSMDNKEISLPSLDLCDGSIDLSESFDEDSYARRDLSSDVDFHILREESREIWSIGIPKNTLKNMSAMEVKRQDHIWEFIMTERNHCRLLKIIDTILRKGCVESGLSIGELNNLFPGVNSLSVCHMHFLKLLLQLRENSEFSISNIGTTINNYFSSKDEMLIKDYGIMSSSIGAIPFYYRKYYRKNKRFSEFVKVVLQNKLLKRKGFSECILLASQRMVKYPLLINDLIKTTSDTIEKSALVEAHQRVRNILSSIDTHVERIQNYKILQDIYDKFDSKSVTVYRSKKFTHATMNNRQHNLKLCVAAKCKSAREKWTDIYIIVLNKMVIFLNELKNAFFSQDGKPSVISLGTLIVRNKDGAKTNLFLMSNDTQHPEMFEVQLKSSDLKNRLSATLKDAMKDYLSDSEDDDTTSKSFRDISDVLRNYDDRIIDILNRKKNAIRNLQLRHDCRKYTVESPKDIDDILSSVIYESSHLVSLLRKVSKQHCTTHTCNTSSCSLHSSSTTADSDNAQVKRAETFGGFEGKSKTYLTGSFKKRSSFRETSTKLLSLSKNSKVRRCSTSIFNSLKNDSSLKDSKRRLSTSALLHHQTSNANFYMQDESHRSSGEISQASEDGSCAGSTILDEQIASVSQLCDYLQTLVKTNLEYSVDIDNLKAKLAKFEDQSSNNMTSRQHDRKLEELRDMQAQLNYEKEKLRVEKENHQVIYESDLDLLTKNTQLLNDERLQVKESKEQIVREKIILQKQMNFFEQQKSQYQNCREVSPGSAAGGIRIVESDNRRRLSAALDTNKDAKTSSEGTTMGIAVSKLSSASMSRQTKPPPPPLLAPKPAPLTPKPTNFTPKPVPLRLPMKLADRSGKSAKSSRTEIYF